MWVTEKSRRPAPDKVQEKTTDIPVMPIYAPPAPRTPRCEYVLVGLKKCPFMPCKQTEESNVLGVRKRNQTVSFGDCLGEQCSAFRITKGIGEGKVRCTCLRLERSAYDEYTAQKLYADEDGNIIH